MSDSRDGSELNAPLSAIRPLSNRAIVLSLILALSVAVGTMIALLFLFSAGSEVDKIRIEALKVGASIGLGTGGVVALVLAARRQRYTELSLEHQRAVLAQQRSADEATGQDAKERRVTELYMKAADQIGSDRAPVRMAGLYALERVGADNPDQRSTILEVICAYLRMPFEPPFGRAADDDGAEAVAARLELEVRLTAQKILVRHMRKEDVDSSTLMFWPSGEGGPVVDLAGASLVDFELENCIVARANFRGARFHGATRIRSSEFVGIANFSSAVFSGSLDLTNCSFNRSALFTYAEFRRPVTFDALRFAGDVDFERAEFCDCTHLLRLRVEERAVFKKSMFHSVLEFRELICRHVDLVDFSNLGVDERYVERSCAPAGWRFAPELGPIDGTVSIVLDIPDDFD